MENNKNNNNINAYEQSVFFQSIVDNVPNMIFVKDAKELRFVIFNKAGEELLGYPKEEMIGKNDYDFFPKDQADFFIKKDRDTLNKKIILDIPEEPIKTRLKGERILHTQKITIVDENGDPKYLLGISEDITDKIELEKKLAEKRSQEIFKVLFDTAIDGIVLVDIETKKFVMSNKSIQKQLGYTPEEISKLGVVDIHPKKDLHLVMSQFEKLVKGEISVDKDVPVKRKDGSVFYADISASSFEFDGKNILLGVFRDITDRKVSQDILERTNKLMNGRELKMIELKKEIEELKQQICK